MMRRTGRYQHGIATVTAVFMIALVGLALGAIAALFAAEARQTHLRGDESQLRELLLAGGDIARGRIAGGDAPLDTAIQAELPALLKARGATLSLTFHDGPQAGQRSAEVHATLGPRQAAQMVTFERGGSGWRVVNAVLTRAF